MWRLTSIICLMFLILSVRERINVSVQAMPTALAQNTTQPLENSDLFAAPPPPNDVGQPGQRSDAGTRGCGLADSGAPSVGNNMTALVPVYESSEPPIVFSQTAAVDPKLWFYNPFTVPTPGTFALEDTEGNVLYEGTFVSPAQSGVVSITLPDTLAPMAVGDRYRWFFVLNCQEDSAIYVVEGWLQRSELTAEIVTQLDGASAQEQVAVYARNGFWQDALTLAAESQMPQWAILLEDVGLEYLATEPILNCCALEERR